MSTESTLGPATDDAPTDSGTELDTDPRQKAVPWVSATAVIACIGVYLGLAVKDDYESWETLSMFGYLPAEAIWRGGYWALVTAAFLHFAFWHLAFNVYWLWVLGSRLERAIGSLPFLAFVVVSAFISSSFQLAVSDSTGIGASGVVYAIFGFMWPTRHRYPQFADVLDTQTIQIFIVWLVGCVIATYLDVWEVGNAAHISGLLFGGAVAGSFALRERRLLAAAGLATLAALSVVPLVWCPWSVIWLSLKAYDAHAAERYDDALHRYTQVIRIDPRNSWAYINRSFVYQSLGQVESAQADSAKARELDPTIEVDK